MAMATESLCHNDPNFAVICNFWDRYGEMIGLKETSYSDLERWLEDTKQVPMPLIDIHVRLLRRIGKTSVTANRWERYIIKFCHTYSDVDAWEIEKFGYKHCKLATKLKLLKNLLEKQFDQNSTFKEKINKLAPEEMRFQPIGRDKNGLAYWYMLDNECNLRVYREDQDDNDAETWEIVCKTRADLAELIDKLEKQIEKESEDKEDPTTSNTNSIKSEVIDEEKKTATSDDSQDSLPDVKKDPEKKHSETEKKCDEVDGIIIDKNKEETKHDAGEKKDVKVEKVEKEGDVSEKTDVKSENEHKGEKKEVKVENDKSIKSEDNRTCENKDECSENKDVKNELNVKKKICDIDSSKPEAIQSTCIKTEPVDNTSESEEKRSEIKTLSSKDKTIDSQEKELKNSQNTDKDTQDLCNKQIDDKCTNKNSNNEASNIKDSSKSEINSKSSDNKTSNSAGNSISDNASKSDEKDANTCIESTNENSEQSKNVSKQNLEANKLGSIEKEEEEKENGDNKLATSESIGATCDKLSESSKLNQEEKCGCDKEAKTKTKGDNQNNSNNNSGVEIEIDNNKSENNVRRSGRARSSRTQSQDLQFKDENSETKDNEMNDKEKTESLANDSEILEQENNKTPSKGKNKSKDKGKKRPLLFEDNSTEDSPTVEPESKKSKPAKKVLTKKSPAKVKSSSEETDDSDDIPLSQIKGTPKSSNKKTPKKTQKNTPKGKGKNAKPTPVRKSSRPVKKKKFDSDEDEEEEEIPTKSKKTKGKSESKKASKRLDDSEDEETPLKSIKKSKPAEEVEEEDDGGRRRSSRVRSLRAKKKELTPPPTSPSEEEEGEDGEHSEFTVDTDLDDSDDEYNLKPKGRNAQRQAAFDEQENAVEIPNDTPCLHCQKTDRPEWLLLCDKCDDAYHTACLRPPLMIIPDGDWFCPPCEHKRLLERLLSSLKDLDIIMKKKDRMLKRKERLAFVGISLDNILKDEHKENVNPVEYDQYSEEEDTYYKPKPQKSFAKRSCRSKNVISYKFDEFDDMINTAIKEDLENPQPYNPGKGRSRGKDMANIYMAEGREYVSEEEGKPSPVGGKKKKRGRRLNDLDSDDLADEDSGDEYRCSDDSVSEPPEEEEEDEDNDVSDYSADGEGWRARGTRRSARRNKGSRRYRDFVVDDEEDSDFAPRRKSARATRASTRQRRKYKEVWSEEEEEELEEESEESVDTEDLCSEDSGPTKKKKNRKEIDKKILRGKKKKNKHSAKRRRLVNSDEESGSSEKSSGTSEESESKSESDDSSVDIGKIKKAAKRKLSKRRYSESSSDSEKSDHKAARNIRRSAAKKVNYKAIAGSDSDATEVSENKSESEEEKKSKKKNVIRDDSTDTDDYYEKKSEEEADEGDTTEEEEKEPVKPKKQKKEEETKEKKEKSESLPEDGKKSVDNTDMRRKPSEDQDSKEEHKNEEDSAKDTQLPVQDIDQSDSHNSEEIKDNSVPVTSICLKPDNAEHSSSTLQSNTGVIRPSPQYSMGQNVPTGNFPSQRGSRRFPAQSPQYGSPPHGQPMLSPPHQPYLSQAGHVMRPGHPPHSQPYTQSPPYNSQMMPGNFPVSSSEQQIPSVPHCQGPVSSQMPIPQTSSNGPFTGNPSHMYGRPQNQPNIINPPTNPNVSNAVQQGQIQQHGPRPEMPLPQRGPYPHQMDGQMMRGPFQNQQPMQGPYPSHQQRMMMQGPHANFQQGQMNQVRGQFPYPNQQGMRGQTPLQNAGNFRGSDPRGMHPTSSERQVMAGPYPGQQSRPMMRPMYPGQPDPHMVRGPIPVHSQGQMIRMQDGQVRPDFSMSGPNIHGPHLNQQGFYNRPMHPETQNMLPGVSCSDASPSAKETPTQSDQKHDDDSVIKKTEKMQEKTPELEQAKSSNLKGANIIKQENKDIERPTKQDEESSTSSTKSAGNIDEKSSSDEKDTKPSLDASHLTSDNSDKEKVATSDIKNIQEGENEKEKDKNVGEKQQSKVNNEKDLNIKEKETPKPDGEIVSDLLSSDNKVKKHNENENTSNTEGKESQIASKPSLDKARSLQSPPHHNQTEGPVIQGPSSNQPEGTMMREPHPYQQGMFRGQFNEMMSPMHGHGNAPRMQYPQGTMDMSQRHSMQGPQNFNQMGQGPRNFIPGMRPGNMGPMQPNFQRPFYGPNPMPYSQTPRMQNMMGPRPEMGMRMPQMFGPDEKGPESSKSKQGDASQSQTSSEPAKVKKPRKPRQTKQQKEKQQAESKTAVSPSPNFPPHGMPRTHPQMTPNQPIPIPMSNPMTPQPNPYVRHPYDNYGMNGMNQGSAEYNQVNPAMYGSPQMMQGNGGRGFMIDNLLDKHPRAQQLEPIISQEDEDESVTEQETSQSYDEEPSPSNGEKDMDEMSDIGDIVKYVMNH